MFVVGRGQLRHDVPIYMPTDQSDRSSLTGFATDSFQLKFY